MTDPEPPGRRHSADVPTPDEIASLLQVEHLLDQRWPETKLEPSTARIAALSELLGSPQRGYPSIHIAGTNGKTSVARMVDARKEPGLAREIQARSTRKYGWGDGLIVELASAPRPRRD